MDPQSPYNQEHTRSQYQHSFGQAQPVQQNTHPINPPAPGSSHNTMSNAAQVGDKIEQIIMLTYLFVAALLAFRFALGLFGARQTPFVEFVRDITIPFMLPFEGMFGTTPSVGYYSIEFEVIVAIIVYALVFFGLGRLVKILLK